MNLIGLGSVGCSVAIKIYEKNTDVYKLSLLDIGRHGKNKVKKIETQNSPEEYEENYKSLKRYFSKLSDHAIVILSGKDMVTSCVLRLLQELKNKTTISILYIKPDITMLGYTARIHERMVSGILQQYARSGQLERLFLVSVSEVERVIDPAPINKYYEHIYETISYAFHMLNYYQNIVPVYDNVSSPHPTARISSFGIFDVKTKEERMFFDLDFPRKIIYYYGIAKSTLDEDHSLFASIKEHLKSVDAKSVECAIYELTSDTNFGIVLKSSTLVQELELDSPN